MHILPISNCQFNYKCNSVKNKTNINFQSGIAIYAGSFDPITNGHLDLIKEASPLFDKLIVLIAKNPNKKSFLPVEKRKNLIEECINLLKNVTVDTYDGLTVNYAKDNGAKYLLRGFRSTADIEYEMQILKFNEKLAPDIKTVFLPASSNNSEISSSKVREFLSNGSNNFVSLVPKPVADYLMNMLKA